MRELLASVLFLGACATPDEPPPAAISAPTASPPSVPVAQRSDDGAQRRPPTDEKTVAVEVRDLPVPDGTTAFALTRMKSRNVMQWRDRVHDGRATFHPPARAWWIEVHPGPADDPHAAAPRIVVLAPRSDEGWTAYTGPGDTVTFRPTVRADGTIELSWNDLVPR